jgi:plastocyanin
VALAVGAAGAPASAAPVASNDIAVSAGATTSGATVSRLTRNQVRARSRALRLCNRKRPARRKAACRRQVVRRYNIISRRQNRPKPATGKTYTVDVGLGGNFFVPAALNIKLNDSINWSWAKSTGFEPHNVNITDPLPAGVSYRDFQSQTTGPGSYRFKRKFVKVGNYSFVCTLHFSMTMSVNVSR